MQAEEKHSTISKMLLMSLSSDFPGFYICPPLNEDVALYSFYNESTLKYQPLVVSRLVLLTFCFPIFIALWKVVSVTS